MRRLLVLSASVLCIACLVVFQPTTVSAVVVCDRIDQDGNPICRDSDPGFDNPPEHQETRCAGLTDASGKAYNKLVAIAGPYYKFGDGQTLVGDPDALAQEIIVDDFDRTYKTPVRGVTPTHRWYDSWCADENGLTLPGTKQSGYVRIVNAANLVQALFVEVQGQLTAAELSWPTVSPTNNWQIVKVPLEIRGTPPAPIHASKSASNITNTLTVTIDAVPTSIAFNPGVRGKAARDNRPVICPIEWLSAPVPPADNPSPCSFTYTISSVNTGGAFTTTATTIWKITTGDPNFNGYYPAPKTKRELLVAEVQALVTGMGSGS